ncbi:hypothetical protein FH972_023345 [Carpinus fangiana]|uniref:Uncharacterized protein n=1 Tax=Carpinus fangiana TaxID=176857 RepID=A0A5N6KV98_9ROSI|nr:hypothetical protein FH972_023345 [Carpinus fangiana]
MPFAIWCQTCPSHSPSRLIGQGVRFNAHKTRVGAYHSTPIWAFELKHTACGGRIEMRTDPAIHDFVVTEGARRRDTGDDAAVAERTGGVLLEGGGMVKSREEEERDRAREDAFVAFEGKKAKAEDGKTAVQRLEELRSVKERDWRDPDAANRRLRNSFRGVRRARDRDRERGESLADAMGFGFELLEGNETDRKMAALVDFETPSKTDIDAPLRVAAKPLFARSDVCFKSDRIVGAQVLHRQLAGNTRASLNPFGKTSEVIEQGHQDKVLRGVKRRQKQSEPAEGKAVSGHLEPSLHPGRDEEEVSEPVVSALVAYDSDSDWNI